MSTAAATTTASWRGLAAVCLAGVVWGTIGPAVDIVDDRSPLSVLTTGAYRGIVAVAALVLMVVVTGRARRCRAVVEAAPGRVVVVGLLISAFQLLFFVAVVSVGVSVATVVCLGFAPVLILVVHSVRDRAAPPPGRLLTVGAAVAGLVLISLAGGGEPDPPHPALGVLAALLSGSAFALSAEVGGPLSKRYDALGVSAVTMTVAGAVLVVVGVPLALLRGEPMTTTDPVAWLLIGYLGLVTMALAYVLFFVGLRTTPSGSVVIATLLEPLTAVVIAVAALGEVLTPAGVVGGVLILAAIATLGRAPRPAESP